MAIVWPCPLSVDAYVAADRKAEFSRPECPSCAGRMVFWSGYLRHVRACGRCQRMFVPRLRCGACQVTHALLPAFTLAWRLDAAETIGTVSAGVAGRAGSGRLRSGPGCRRRRRADGAGGSASGRRGSGWRSRRWRSSWAGSRSARFHASCPAITGMRRQNDGPSGTRADRVASLGGDRRGSQSPADRRRAGRWSGRSPRALTLTPTGSHGGIPGHNRPVDPGTWRAGGLESLKPAPRADTGAVRAHPELFAEAAAPASISTRAGLSSAVR